MNLDASRFYPRQLSLDTITVGGNWGTLTVDKVTGRVLSLDERNSDHDDDQSEDASGYRDIVKVDLKEFYEFYGADDASEHIDILDVGFWFTDGLGGVGYEMPEHDWRADLRLSELVAMPGHTGVLAL